MDLLGPWHLIIVAGVFVLLFGAKRLPDAARSLGKSAHILKTEISSLHHDNDTSTAPTARVAEPVSLTAPTVSTAGESVAAKAVR
jgi:sec-independent protein translocase protein TatA